jgi:glycosyltransferase involved in cell wall biosynthesis
MTDRRRVLIVQSTLRPPGGTQAVAAWMIEALKDTCEVGLACWEPPVFEAVNHAYGTTIADRDVSVHAVPGWYQRTAAAMPVSLALFRWALVLRLARRVAHSYDVLISAENEADLGREAIQYIHYPRQLRPRPAADLRWYHRPRALLGAYYALCDRMTGFTLAGVRRNRTLANSAWTAGRVREMDGGVAVSVLPPPVAPALFNLPWEERANGFLCIGRIAAEKEIEKVIAIVEAARQQAPGLELHLVGSRGSEAAYYEKVRALVAARPSWLHLHEHLSRSDLQRMAGSYRYGIHGMRDEHFGMATAEMVEGGCIVFVPDSGGQVEIVGGNSGLIYANPDDAVQKIVQVLNSSDRQAELRAELAQRRGAFSSDRFMQAIRDAVAAMHADRSVGLRR